MAFNVLIVGIGGIGGTIAATLAEHAVADVTAYSRNPRVREALHHHGYRLRGVGGDRTIPAHVTDELPDTGDFSHILIATQPPQMVQAARSVVDCLAPDGLLISLQNGLPEPYLAPLVGAERVGSAIVGWGASMPEPGLFAQTSAGGFTISSEPRLDGLAQLLAPVGPITRTDNLLGARWSKLAFNCAISTLGTLGGDTLGALIAHRRVRRLALEIFAEVLTVTDAEGVTPEKLASTLDLSWLAVDSRPTPWIRRPALVLRHGLLWGVGLKYRRLRSSMLAALERGREPAVDHLNGEVVRLADTHGLSVPINRVATELVHAIHQGERQPGLALIDELWSRTRPVS